MEILEIKEKYQLRREEAADYLRRLADSLARHNEVEFVQHGKTVRVDVADQVELEIELEVEADESKLEVEISW